MDPKAENYDPDAEKEDGSCRYQSSSSSSPATYAFEDALLEGGRVRVELLDRLVQEVEKGRKGSSIALQDLLDLYRNNGMAGNGTYDLEGTLEPADSLFFLNVLQDVASRGGDPASIVAGRFVSADSIAYSPMLEKGLMGSAFFEYSTRSLLEDLQAHPHDQPEASSPTEREAVYDEAFALFGVPRDFSRETSFGTAPSYGKGAWFWGDACLRTDSALEQLPALFDAFVEGRWALTEEKSTRRKEAIGKVEESWERTAAALMVRHIKRCIRAIDNGDLGDRIGHWSHAHGVLLALDGNDDGIITLTEHQNLRKDLGDTPNECSISSLNSALAQLQNIYGFSNSAFQGL